jgi:fibronectin-binding autotransporter adhesin
MQVRKMPSTLKISPLLVFILSALAAFGSRIAQAQLVADGSTNIISGYTTNVAGDLIVGTNGSFTRLLITSAGVVTNTGNGYIGQNFGASSNQVEVSDINSSWQVASNLWVGNLFGGICNELVISNGASMLCSSAIVGQTFSGGNSITVSGFGSVLMASAFQVGKSSISNRVVISQGGQVADSSGRIGTDSSYNVAEFNLVLVTDPGSLWTNGSALSVGDTGSYNQLIISNGGMVIDTDGFIGHNLQLTSNNVVTVTGPGSVWDNQNNLYIGYSGRGNQLIISNGGTVYNNVGCVGQYWTNNIVTVAGHGSTWNCRSNLIVGYSGGWSFLKVSDGGTIQSPNCTIGFNNGGDTAVVTDSGSSLIIQSNLWVGYNGGVDHLIVTNAALVKAADLYVGNLWYAPGNSVLIDSGSIIATNLVDMRVGQLLLQSGLLTTAALWLTNGSLSQMTFSGGTLQTGSTIHNTGSPLVVGGSATPATFELSGNGSHVFSSGLLVASNGMLKGNGSVTGNVTVAAGGTISPGASVGQFVINGGMVLSNGSTTVVELEAVAGTNDNFSGLTSVTYGGTLRLSNLAGVLTNGTKFKLFTAGNYSGAFDGLEAASPGPGLKWNTSQINVDGTLRVVAAPSPPATITRVEIAGTSLIISASGGIAYDSSYLLSSTNVAQPLANWVRIATNRFNSDGTVNLTNPIVRGEPRRYFRLATD